MFKFRPLVYAAIVGIAFAAFAESASAARKYKQIKIGGDRGGHVIAYALKVAKARKSGQRVVIGGRCASACTLYLSMPRNKMCIGKGASFAFHKPYGASGRGNRIAAAYMMRKYPGWVRSWIARNGGLSSRMITMNYSYASKFLPTCTAGTSGPKRGIKRA